MNEHVNPTIATVLHRCWPVPAGQNAQAALRYLGLQA